MIRKTFTPAAFLLACLALAGCGSQSHGLATKTARTPAGPTGTLIAQVEWPQPLLLQAKALPNSTSSLTFTVTDTNPQISTTLTRSPSTGTIMAQLTVPAGTHSLTVSAFNPASGSTPIATGGQQGIVISGGANTTVYVALTVANPPIINALKLNQPVEVDDHTAALWHLDEDSGTSVADSTANGNTGTATGTTIINSSLSRARNFNGSVDYVAAANSSSLNPTSAITMEAWIKPTNISSHYWYTIIRQDSRITDVIPAVFNFKVLWFEVYGTYLTLAFSVGGDIKAVRFATSPGEWTDGNWHHVAGTYDGTNMKLYKDGSLVATQAATGSIDTQTTPLYIGCGFAIRDYFKGAIDEVRISNVARSADEIASIWNPNLPLESLPGSVVSISGSNFGATQTDSLVTFNGFPALPADIVTWSATQVLVKVPVGSTSGNVNVTVDGITSNPYGYTVDGQLAVIVN